MITRSPAATPAGGWRSHPYCCSVFLQKLHQKGHLPQKKRSQEPEAFAVVNSVVWGQFFCLSIVLPLFLFLSRNRKSWKEGKIEPWKRKSGVSSSEAQTRQWQGRSWQKQAWREKRGPLRLSSPASWFLSDKETTDPAQRLDTLGPSQRETGCWDSLWSECSCFSKKDSQRGTLSHVLTEVINWDYSYQFPYFSKFSSDSKILKRVGWASLVAQWLRIRLPMQGTWVRALVWEDPTCRGATRLVSHNYWACASGACAPQQERPR